MLEPRGFTESRVIRATAALEPLHGETGPGHPEHDLERPPQLTRPIRGGPDGDQLLGNRQQITHRPSLPPLTRSPAC